MTQQPDPPGEAVHAALLRAAQATPHGDLSASPLPDDREPEPDGLHWAPGALEGVLGHHAGPDASPAEAIADLVMTAQSGDVGDLQRLHDAAAEHEATASYVDRVFDILSERRPTVAGVSGVGRWLIHNATSRGAAKLGIALVGVTRTVDERDAVMLFGRHDEFTLFAAVALANMDPSPELSLWELAQHVTGWGRIHIVERLRGTTDPAIRAWLLRDGFRNSVMNEYLAYIAATTGDLAGALAADDVDDALFDAAGEIIEALLGGGPAEDIDDYDAGSEVVRRYVTIALTRASSLRHLRVAIAISQWVADEDADWEGAHHEDGLNRRVPRSRQP